MGLASVGCSDNVETGCESDSECRSRGATVDAGLGWIRPHTLEEHQVIPRRDPNGGQDGHAGDHLCIAYLFPVAGIEGANAMVGLQVGYSIADITAKAGMAPAVAPSNAVAV